MTLCTGNVSRSVMLGYMLTTLAGVNGDDWTVRSAGTHVTEGAAMSSRTLGALLGVEDLGEHHFSAHRSHQLSAEDVTWADLIVTAEADHVRFVRRNFFEGAEKTVQLAQFLREAPLDAPWLEQLREVAGHEPSDTFDVTDPAGGDQAAYDECATTLWLLAQALSTMVGG